ncbi:MAG: hypothetical protein LBE85_01665 [Candidatus Accumulibacter sp.]|nr:hypothetical protein [Accumulibacter sp.]
MISARRWGESSSSSFFDRKAGRLGELTRESAQAAPSVARKRSRSLAMVSALAGIPVEIIPEPLPEEVADPVAVPVPGEDSPAQARPSLIDLIEADCLPMQGGPPESPDHPGNRIVIPFSPTRAGPPRR